MTVFWWLRRMLARRVPFLALTGRVPPGTGQAIQDREAEAARQRLLDLGDQSR
ncbi:hypothetical protein ACIBO1_27500 [Micromonospora sp. NPDC049903]|uniref:hypothetical protein n=1 Tax=Micromonospora sp. NPDC049903 TaxID=3364276 RepID=UPI0037AF5454